MFQAAPAGCFVSASLLAKWPSLRTALGMLPCDHGERFPLALLSDGSLRESGKSQAESLAEQLACVLRGRLAHLKSSLCFARDAGLQCCL